MNYKMLAFSGLKHLVRGLRSLFRRFTFVVDGFFLRTASDKSDVAIVRMDAIGDFFVWLDTAKEFRNIYPGKKIVLIGNSAWADFAKFLPYWDEVWSIDARKFSKFGAYRFKWISSISAYGFESCIQPAYSRLSTVSDSIVRATQSDCRVSPMRDLNNNHIPESERIIVNAWYTHQLPSFPGVISEFERNSDFLNKLTSSSNYKPSIATLQIFPDINNSNLSKYFIVSPGASWVGRMWSADKFTQLILDVKSRYRLNAVLCGSRAERSLCEQIATAVGDHVLNTAGETSLTEMVGLISSAQMIVTNDTSGIHIAAAVGTPSVCIVGGGHFGRFLPYPQELVGNKPHVVNYDMECYGCNWCCSKPHERGCAVPCIGNITVTDVMAAVNKILDKDYRSNHEPAY